MHPDQGQIKKGTCCVCSDHVATQGANFSLDDENLFKNVLAVDPVDNMLKNN